MAEEMMEYRTARPADLEQLGDLRWRLQTDDREDFDPTERSKYIADFVSLLENEKDCGRLVHWVAVRDAAIIAAMSIRIVNKLPKPGKYDGRWGYLTNVYTLPAHRGSGVGSQLLAAVKDWAKQERLELLLAWPSDDAYSFYEGAGFRRNRDPLVLDLE